MSSKGHGPAIQERWIDRLEHKWTYSAAVDAAIRRYRGILDGSASPALFARSLLDLSACLRAHYGENVLILIDEYDEPIHSGHAAGYAPEILAFMREFFIDGLKGNPHIFRAVLTGILRVSKESLFSGANNFGVYPCSRGPSEGG